MRELKRSIAKARMRERGLTKINRQRFSKKGGGAFGSFFSRNWRKFAAMEPLKPKRRRRAHG